LLSPVYAYDLLRGMLHETLILLLRKPIVILNIRDSGKVKPKDLQKKCDDLIA